MLGGENEGMATGTTSPRREWSNVRWENAGHPVPYPAAGVHGWMSWLRSRIVVESPRKVASSVSPTIQRITARTYWNSISDLLKGLTSVQEVKNSQHFYLHSLIDWITHTKFTASSRNMLI